MNATQRGRVHVIAGGYPPGADAGHDHDFARLRILELLEEQGLRASVGNDFTDIERWLPLSGLMITYVAGPYATDDQSAFLREWLEGGGHWLGLHGTSGGKAARVPDERRRRMVKTSHHAALGAFFLNHPPVRKFRVDVADGGDALTRGLPESFEVVDEPYMVEIQEPSSTRALLTAELGPDASPPGFGFLYDEDTALMPDGLTRVLGYTRDVGAGGVTYIALGHNHSPQSNSQPFVDSSVEASGTTPTTLRCSWDSEHYVQLLRNAIEWGTGGA